MPLHLRNRLPAFIFLCSAVLTLLAPAKQANSAISQYAFEGYLYLNDPDQGITPASGDTIWAFNLARDDSVFAVTDVLGFYRHAPATGVGDVPQLSAAMLRRVYPNPDPRAVELQLPAEKQKGDSGWS